MEEQKLGRVGGGLTWRSRSKAPLPKFGHAAAADSD